jgi:RsiW-degrading membrane proteinase PrsW (M82 family)
VRSAFIVGSNGEEASKLLAIWILFAPPLVWAYHRIMHELRVLESHPLRQKFQCALAVRSAFIVGLNGEEASKLLAIWILFVRPHADSPPFSSTATSLSAAV